MKKLIVLFSLVTGPLMASAMGQNTNANKLFFELDWNVEKSLVQNNTIGCDAEGASVTLKIPGILNRNFKIQDPGGSCRMVSYNQAYDKKGKAVTTLIYIGDDCYSDNDENFFVQELDSTGKPTGKEAALTADAGC